MFKHILIATDGSKFAEVAVKAGMQLAASLGAKTTSYCAVDVLDEDLLPEEGYVPSVEIRKLMAREARAYVEKSMERVSELASAAGVQNEVFVEDNLYPWKGIIDAARTRKCDVIVMASHGKSGVGGVLLGSVTQKVLANSVVPVLVYR